jgi:photosystem I P700 chlorophyll a apoprotein A2
MSLYLTDIAHHHLAVGVLFVWAGHVYSSLYKGFGHRIRDVLFVNGNSGPMISLLGKSLHLQLSLALAGLSVITSVVAQHIYSLAPYPYLSYDSVTFVALYVHHSWIASFLMMGSFAHAGIFLIRDYTINVAASTRPKQEQDVICRILAHKAAIISHLSWICLWLGFHTLGLYIHNDTVVAFGEPEKQILIEPVFAQIIQGSYCQSFGSFLLPLGPGDLLAHHAIALGLHVTVLILLKGSLDGRGSKLMPDKIHFGYGFACDGPGRGGTCDISAWDSFYLATFWMLNTNAWVIFYFHWKHLTLNTAFQFDESSTYLNGWFRDYLWFNSASLIRGYDALGANDLSVWAWTFLGAHLCWATGFMFLISWRGYWQELIDIILYMHLKTPILYDLFSGGVYTPVALSIVQARFIGLLHFSVGFVFTYAAFVVGATS